MPITPSPNSGAPPTRACGGWRVGRSRSPRPRPAPSWPASPTPTTSASRTAGGTATPARRRREGGRRWPGCSRPDPAGRAAAITDVTHTWPTEHLALLQEWAEHTARSTRPDPENAADHDTASHDTADLDAVGRARAAVDALPTADQLADDDADAAAASVGRGDDTGDDAAMPDGDGDGPS